jgi:hypothetical protein
VGAHSSPIAPSEHLRQCLGISARNVGVTEVVGIEAGLSGPAARTALLTRIPAVAAFDSAGSSTGCSLCRRLHFITKSNFSRLRIIGYGSTIFQLPPCPVLPRLSTITPAAWGHR